MKLPIAWLKEYVDVKLSPEKLAEALTMSGTAVDKIEKHDHTAVFDIEITTNRPDCLSILGLAMEVAALTGKQVRFPEIGHDDSPKKVRSTDRLMKIQVDAKKACVLYSARLIQNVDKGILPERFSKYLQWVGARAIHPAVDATNVVLFEMGQPLHAFDYDKLTGKKITVRFSKNGEKFLAINNVEYTLDDKTLVIADESGPIAIAGVIGGKATEVGPGTKNILLESAFFDPAVVRGACRRYGLSTDSSYRFERGVDIQQVLNASGRAADLITQWAKGAKDAGFWAVKGHGMWVTTKKITVLPEYLQRLLGVSIPPRKAISILNRLGFQTKFGGGGAICLTPWRRRLDIAQEADVVEEILRIYGFEKIPTAIPVTRHLGGSIENKKSLKIEELKSFLACQGFYEIITYSLVSKKALIDSGWQDESAAQKIINPLSAEQEFFRPSLLPGMLGVVSFNLHRKAESLKLFEVGNCCLGGQEKTRLIIAVSGLLEENWKRKTPFDFYELKGLVENVLGFFQIRDWTWKETSICVGDKILATLQTAGKNAREAWDISQEVFYAEFCLDEIFKSMSEAPVFKVRPIPKFPLVRRDIAFLVEQTVPVGDLRKTIFAAAGSYLKEARLFDQYLGKNIPAGKRSLAFSLAYQKEDGTFTDEEIQKLQHQVGEALKQSHQVEFR
jgi:phenylalanyl-tRNA synthetase beta chain